MSASPQILEGAGKKKNCKKGYRRNKNTGRCQKVSSPRRMSPRMPRQRASTLLQNAALMSSNYGRPLSPMMPYAGSPMYKPMGMGMGVPMKMGGVSVPMQTGAMVPMRMGGGRK